MASKHIFVAILVLGLAFIGHSVFRTWCDKEIRKKQLAMTQNVIDRFSEISKLLVKP